MHALGKLIGATVRSRIKRLAERRAARAMEDFRARRPADAWRYLRSRYSQAEDPRGTRLRLNGQVAGSLEESVSFATSYFA